MQLQRQKASGSPDAFEFIVAALKVHKRRKIILLSKHYGSMERSQPLASAPPDWSPEVVGLMVIICAAVVAVDILLQAGIRAHTSKARAVTPPLRVYAL